MFLIAVSAEWKCSPFMNCFWNSMAWGYDRNNSPATSLSLSLSPSLSPISWDYTSVNSSKTNFYTFPRICAFLDNIRMLKSFIHYMFVMEKMLKELKICGIMLLITTKKKTCPTEQIIKCIDRNQRTSEVYGSVVVEIRTFL